MNVQKIQADHPDCPDKLRQALAQTRSHAVWTIGNQSILEAPLLGLFCSQKCPGDLIIKTFDTIRQLRDAGVPMVGGFHSSIEKECLDLLLRGKQPVVVCPARGIENMRLPCAWKKPLSEGRLLVLSPFDGRLKRRMTTELAQQRNRFVAILSRALLVPHAAPAGNTERLCFELLREGKIVHTFENGQNCRLLDNGATVVMPSAFSIADIALRALKA